MARAGSGPTAHETRSVSRGAGSAGQGVYWNFAACRLGCAPLAYWGIYFFTFKNARRSAFHLSTRRTLISFGNYPIPIKVRGRFVACNRAETKFLITYGSAVGLGLACLSTHI
jgi:hypothetical protein